MANIIMADPMGTNVSVESKSISVNGIYIAPAGKAYSPVTVAVENSYTASDEGKVVSNGALITQTAHAIVTENGTIDTTLNNSVEVAVPSGGTDRLKTATLTLTQDYPQASDVGTRIKGLIDAAIGTDYWVAVVSDAPSTMADLTAVVCYLAKISSLNVANMQGYDVNVLGNNATSPGNACYWRTYSTVYPQGSYVANTNAKAYSGMTYQIWGWNA